MADESEYLTSVRVAEIFGVKGETIRDWRKAGKIRGTKINGRWYFTRESVSALATERHG